MSGTADAVVAWAVAAVIAFTKCATTCCTSFGFLTVANRAFG
jgi:hypothetical protein